MKSNSYELVVWQRLRHHRGTPGYAAAGRLEPGSVVRCSRLCLEHTPVLGSKRLSAPDGCHFRRGVCPVRSKPSVTAGSQCSVGGHDQCSPY